MLNNFRKLNKKYFLAIFLLLLFFSLVLGVDMVRAAAADTLLKISGGIADAIMKVLGWVFYIIAAIVGLILMLLIQILVDVAKFNNIIDVYAVNTGWVIVRDLCNMFFVLILLVIAFATILRIESYNAKKFLPKLLIMAVLINFSKMIFGLVVDFAQVIMLTFVDGFGQYGANNLVNLFQINKYLAFSETPSIIGGSGSEGKLGTWETTGAVLAGFFAIIITTITVAVLLAVLIFRIIMLWVYTILSPFVFLGAAFPPMQKYTGRIWEDFIKNVVVGPILAFFIWLALLTASQSKQDLTTTSQITQNGQTIEFCGTNNSLFCSNNFQTYIITIALLIGGLMVTQQIGGAAGSIAGKGLAWARRAPLLAGAGVAGLSAWGARKLKAKTGLELRPTKIISGIRETLADKKRQEEITGEGRAGAALRKGKLWGGLGASRDFSEEATRGFLWHRGWLGKDSTIWRTRKAGKIRKDIEKKEKEKEEKGKTAEEKEKIDSEIKTMRESLKDYKTPYTFYADEKRNAAYREQMKKLYDIDNEEQLATMFLDAIHRGEEELAGAVVMHAAKVGHSNEVLELVPSLKDVYDDKGNLLTKKGQNIIAGPEGVKALFDQYFIGKLGMSDQEANSIMSQYSTLAKQAGHYDVSEMVGVDEGGLLRVRSASEQMKRASIEIMKTDPEGSLRRLNRLGHMSEMQYTDNKNIDQRVAIVTELTERNFLKQAPAMDVEVNKRKRLNQNYAENLYKNFLIAERQKKTGDLQGLPLQLTSILGLMQEKYKDKTYKDADGNEKSYVQLAAQALSLGKEKYDTAARMEITTDINKSEEEKEAEIAILNKESEEMGEVLNKVLQQFPSPEPKSKSTPPKKHL